MINSPQWLENDRRVLTYDIESNKMGNQNILFELFF